jgi:hypothetical protein
MSARHAGARRKGKTAGVVASCNSMAAGKSAIQSSCPSQFMAFAGNVEKLTQIAAVDASWIIENGGMAKF